ncbi:MAG TPA: hypothetical protein VIH61_07920 [Waddliaceae bacterium]
MLNLKEKEEIVPVDYMSTLKELKAENKVEEKPLPDYCFIVLAKNPEGKRIAALKFKTHGYFDTDLDNEGLSVAQLQAKVEKLNNDLGLTFAQKKAMTYGAYVSWNVQEATPAFYEDKH